MASRKFLESRLVIASHNEGKIKEISALLKPFNVDVTSSKALQLIEPYESGDTYLENALIKARACSDATGFCVLSDDSGIELAALGNKPGVHTAPFTKDHGGLDVVFAEWASNPAIALNPSATFMCVQVLLWPDGHYEYFTGMVSGRLTFPRRGSNGHGYDPVFIPNGFDKTVAEMTDAQKNSCSHRFIALNQLINTCFTT